MDRIPQMIVSGGQTGADRAALGFAIDHGIPHGGWCPKGRLAEDGPVARPIPIERDAKQQLSAAFCYNARWSWAHAAKTRVPLRAADDTTEAHRHQA
jgi:hypothetical protein